MKKPLLLFINLDYILTRGQSFYVPLNEASLADKRDYVFYHAELLKFIIKETNCKIISTSSSVTFDPIVKEAMTYFNINLSGVIPYHYRQDQAIMRYLNDNPHSKFAIITANSFWRDTDILEPNIVDIDISKGLLEDDVDRVITILKGKLKWRIKKWLKKRGQRQ